MKPATPAQKERRERILATTRELLAKQGYEGINMRSLAEASGVATTTLYNLYQSKDELILAAMDDLLASMRPEARDDSLNALDMYLQDVKAASRQIMATPNYAAAMARLLFNAEPSSPIVEAMLARSVRTDKKIVEELKSEGVLREDIDVNLASRRMAGAHWMNLFMWMKGFVALHDYETESLKAHIDLLSAYATQKGREQLATWRPVN